MKPFLGIKDPTDIRYSIIPVPYEGTSSYMRGMADAPEMILEASANLEPYDYETDIDLRGAGIITRDPIDPESTPEDMLNAIEAVIARNLIRGRMPIMIGGNHTITIGALRAMHKQYKDFSVLTLDAHADMKKEYDESKFSHASVMSRAAELTDTLTIGVRSIDLEEKNAINASQNKVIFARDMLNDRSLWVNAVDEMLKDNVYLSIDMDVFDPSLIPSTGTPEPGGLGWYDVLEIITEVSKKKNIIGFDIVELMPIKGMHSCDFITAKLLLKIISMIEHKRMGKK